MSIRALLLGIEKRLRSADVFNDRPQESVGAYFGVHPAPGSPPPNFGQWYCSIAWGGGRQSDQDPQSQSVYHGAVLTLTARLNYAPRDRQGKRLTTVGDIYDLVETICAPNVIHGNWLTVFQYANEFIEGTAQYVEAAGAGTATVNGFMETLVLDTYGPERVAPPGWGGIDAPKDVYVIDMRFARARRIQGVY
jgi:hypothetical protein